MNFNFSSIYYNPLQHIFISQDGRTEIIDVTRKVIKGRLIIKSVLILKEDDLSDYPKQYKCVVQDVLYKNSTNKYTRNIFQQKRYFIRKDDIDMIYTLNDLNEKQSITMNSLTYFIPTSLKNTFYGYPINDKNVFSKSENYTLVYDKDHLQTINLRIIPWKNIQVTFLKYPPKDNTIICKVDGYSIIKITLKYTPCTLTTDTPNCDNSTNLNIFKINKVSETSHIVEAEFNSTMSGFINCSASNSLNTMSVFKIINNNIDEQEVCIRIITIYYHTNLNLFKFFI